MIAVAIFPVFCFAFLKLNLFPALHLLCQSDPSLLPSADRALLLCVIDLEVQDIIFETIFSPSEPYKNIPDNPEYNSIQDNPEHFCREYVERIINISLNNWLFIFGFSWSVTKKI